MTSWDGLFACFCCLIGIGLAFTQETHAQTPANPLGGFLWKNRLVIIVSEEATDELIQAQLEVQAQYMLEWKDRDLIWLWVSNSGGLDQLGQEYSPEACQVIQKKYDLGHHPSQVILVGKDGGRKMQKFSSPFTSQELFRVIDRMPMRRQEMQTGKP